MKTLMLLLGILLAGFVRSDAGQKLNTNRGTTEGRQLDKIVRIGTNAIVVHTEFHGIKLRGSEKLLSYQAGERFLVKFLSKSGADRDVVVYQDEKELGEAEINFMERLSSVANDKGFRIIIFPPGTGRIDKEYVSELNLFLKEEEGKSSK